MNTRIVRLFCLCVMAALCMALAPVAQARVPESASVPALLGDKDCSGSCGPGMTPVIEVCKCRYPGVGCKLFVTACGTNVQLMSTDLRLS